MGVVTEKAWTFTCDATTPQGTSGCGEWVRVSDGDVGLWTGDKIFTRGAATTELRRSGWTAGTVVLCPAHTKTA